MPQLIQFRAEHMLAFENRDNVIQNMSLHKQKELLGPAFTGIHENRILGCAGVMIMWAGVGVAWCAFSSEITEHKIWMTTHIARIMKDIIRGHKLHRIEAVVLADNDRNIEWIEMLGFTKEKDIAQAYTSDKRNVYRYELIINSDASISNAGR